jgi:hypothetical protein
MLLDDRVQLPEVYKAVFEACGERFEDYIDMEQLPYIYDVYFEKVKPSFLNWFIRPPIWSFFSYNVT